MTDYSDTRCRDCLVETSHSEWYIVKDNLWREATSSDCVDFLCVGCLEKRIERRLIPNDFKAIPINFQECDRSERLLERMGSLEKLSKDWTERIGRMRIPSRVVKKTQDDLLEMALAELSISVRTLNGLEKYDIFRVKDLLEYSKEEIMAMPNFGAQTIKELLRALKEVGIDAKFKRQ